MTIGLEHNDCREVIGTHAANDGRLLGYVIRRTWHFDQPWYAYRCLGNDLAYIGCYQTVDEAVEAVEDR